MADRTVKVNLIAQVNDYVSGMDRAAKSTRELGSESEKLAAKKEGFETLGRGALVFGAIAAAGVAVAIRKFAEFDEAMSNVQAATQESAENMGLLRDAALAAGADTVFSATEAANAIEELGKNGLTTAQILDGGLSGALALATSGQLDVGRAAEIAAISMKQFGLAGAAVPHIADLLAAGAGKAAGDVEDLAQALAQSGLVANQTGLSIEETTGVLAAFADKGLIGSDAGTSFKTMLQSLTPSSKQAADEMKRLGIEAFDSSGQFVGISKFAGVYRDSLSKLSPEQQAATSKIIFGSDAVRASNVLYDLGAEGIQKYIDQTNDSGYAAKVAADRLNNLSGDIEKLGGSFDTALIQSGSGANDVLRELVQGITFLVDGIGDLPQPALNVGLALTVAASAMGLAGGGALVAVPKFVAAKAALTSLGISGKAAALGVGLAGGALTAATLLLGVFIAKEAAAASGGQEFADSLDDTTGALTDYSRELLVKKLSEADAFENAKAAGISQKELTDAIVEGGSKLEEVNKKLSSSTTIFDVFSENGAKRAFAKSTVKDLADQLDRGRTSFENEARAANESTDSLAGVATGLSTVEDGADGAATEIDSLAKALADFGKVGLETRASNRAFEAAIDDATEAAKKNGETLDDNSAKGRANNAALDALAQGANAVAAAKLHETQSVVQANEALERGREKYIKTAISMGATATEAERMADSFIALPKNVDVEFKERGLTSIRRAFEALLAKDGSTINLGVEANGRPVNKGQFSSGGYTGSIGRKRVAGVVHGNEFVNDADSTAKPENRAALEYMNRGGSMNDYQRAAPAPVYLAAPPVYSASGSSGPTVNVNFDNFREKSVAEASRESSQIIVAALGLS